jgi:hypothetical protein
MASMNLKFLDEEAQRVVRQMLAAVADRPDLHINLVTCRNKGRGEWEYFVGQTGQGASAFPQLTRIRSNAFAPLVGHGFMEANRKPGYQEGAMCFTQAAIDWHHATKGPTDREVQQDLAKVLKRHRIRERRQNESLPIDIPTVAAAIGVSEDRILDAAYELLDTERADGPETLGKTVEEGWFTLSDAGGAWIESGFAAQPVFNFTFNFDFRFAIQATINSVQREDLPEQFRDAFIEALEDLKEEPTAEKLRNLVTFGADVGTFGDYTFKFLQFLIPLFAQSPDWFNSILKFPHLVI